MKRYAVRPSRLIRVLALLLALSTVATFGAVAQGPGGPQLADADRDAAWILQAKGVAASLGLADENAAKLADAYIASRKSLQETVENMADTGERGAGRFEAYRKATDEERGKLETTLAGFLTAEQATKATASLGTFSRQWDRMVHTLAGFNLDSEKLNKALALVEGYVVESDAAMRGDLSQQDWQALRTKVQEMKSGLDTSLAEVLSPEQLATWKEATTFRGGRGGAGGRSEGQSERRNDENAGSQG